MKRKIMITCTLLLFFVTAQAQILNPVTWSYAAKKISATECILYFKASIDDSWRIYSLNQQAGGPLKTTLSFIPSADYTLTGKALEPEPLSKFEETFGMMVYFFKNEVVFQQKIKLKKPVITIKGKIVYMACTDERCTPPLDVKFSIPIK